MHVMAARRAFDQALELDPGNARLYSQRGYTYRLTEAGADLVAAWDALKKQNDAANQPAAKLTRQMSEMLTHSGFTIVVDTGSDGENTIALRRRVDSGPRMRLAAGGCGVRTAA